VKRLAAILAWALLLALLASCGGKGKFEEGELKDGRATGAGFAFTLPEGWKSELPSDATKREVARTVSKALPGLDLQGIFLAGYWAKPSDRDRRALVNVGVEPVTADTDLERVIAGAEGLLGSKAESLRRLGAPAKLGEEPAVTLAYRAGKLDKRAITAKRGDYAYTVNVQMKTGYSADLDALTRRVAKSWRWRPPDARQRSRLAAVSRASGRGYRTTLPPGWRATGQEALRKSGATGIDSLWRGHVGASSSTNVNVAAVQAPGQDLEEILGQVIASERAQARQGRSGFEIESLRKGADTTVGGDEAKTIELRSTARGQRLGQRELVTLHSGTLYRITLSAERARYAQDSRAFERTLRAWRWTN